MTPSKKRAAKLLKIFKGKKQALEAARLLREELAEYGIKRDLYWDDVEYEIKIFKY